MIVANNSLYSQSHFSEAISSYKLSVERRVIVDYSWFGSFLLKQCDGKYRLFLFFNIFKKKFNVEANSWNVI